MSERFDYARQWKIVRGIERLMVVVWLWRLLANVIAYVQRCWHMGE